ncbi:hypothetical protein MTR_0115s0050 [Medicago truncatula]|uniref:Uncharacterized protein n=1 Tax=Medicago truncatula TaxID=3880 RepID=A0A072TIF3_MEDTR|nr:hypothetical protein MTR_0115s0050 [Medicago truncatula]
MKFRETRSMLSMYSSVLASTTLKNHSIPAPVTTETLTDVKLLQISSVPKKGRVKFD